MFFIGGVQPRTVTLEERPNSCPNCAHNSLKLKRTDMYISLFFIPLIRYKTGDPFLTCESCNVMLEEDGYRGYAGNQQNQQAAGASAPSGGRQQMCGHCSAMLEPDAGYSYCPYCGKRI